MILGDLLYEFLRSDKNRRKELTPEIMETLDNLRSVEVDDSYKQEIKESLLHQMHNNILTSKDIQNHLYKLIILKFQ